METTYAFLKQNALATFLVVAVLSANGQIWLLDNRTQGLADDIQDLRADMVAGNQAIRADMAVGDQAIRAEMAAGHQAIRAEMAAGDKAIRAEMAAGHQAIRAEMAEEFKAVRSDISDLRERMARVETRLGSIEDRLYMDTANPPL